MKSSCAGGAFTGKIQNSPPAPHLKIPKFDKYEGTSNAQNHVICFEATMGIVSHDRAVRCWAFVSSLSHKALKCYGQLPSNSDDGWKTFKRLFPVEFSCPSNLPKEDTDLVNVKQEGDSNLEYFECFKKVHDLIDIVSDDFVVKCFRGGLVAGSIRKIEFASIEPEDRNGMFRRAKRIATTEAPKGKPNKKAKGKESQDNSMKSKPAIEAKEKLETS